MPCTPAWVAVTTPLPALNPAVNVVLVPFAGENVPPPAVVVHVGSNPAVTGFVNWSNPVATNVRFAPSARLTDAGDTVIRDTGPGLTVSVWLDELKFCAEAVSTGLPALVSW